MQVKPELEYVAVPLIVDWSLLRSQGRTPFRTLYLWDPTPSSHSLYIFTWMVFKRSRIDSWSIKFRDWLLSLRAPTYLFSTSASFLFFCPFYLFMFLFIFKRGGGTYHAGGQTLICSFLLYRYWNIYFLQFVIIKMHIREDAQNK